MTASFKIKETDSIQATMTITMSLLEWKRLRTTVESNMNGYDLRFAIQELVDKAEAIFETETKV